MTSLPAFDDRSGGWDSSANEDDREHRNGAAKCEARISTVWEPAVRPDSRKKPVKEGPRLLQISSGTTWPSVQGLSRVIPSQPLIKFEVRQFRSGFQ